MINIKIMAFDRKTGDQFPIEDNLYFFEEEGIRTLLGDALTGEKYSFVFVIDDGHYKVLVDTAVERMMIFLDDKK